MLKIFAFMLFFYSRYLLLAEHGLSEREMHVALANSLFYDLQIEKILGNFALPRQG